MLPDYIAILLDSSIVEGIVSSYISDEYPDDIRLKVRAELRNGWQIDCFEHIFPSYRRYSFHVFQGNRQITRWDNAPHWPGNSTFPHHQHIRGRVVDSEEMDLNKVLAQLESMM